MAYKVLVTDYVWPSVEPEKAVLAQIGAELVVAPDGSEATLAELARDVDGILTCFAQPIPSCGQQRNASWSGATASGWTTSR